MGWKIIKAQVIKALKNGTFQHEARREIETKNLLQMGRITPNDVRMLLERARGTDHASRPHHRAPSVTVHIVTVQGWYIKFYFVEPDTVFISVHRTGATP